MTFYPRLMPGFSTNFIDRRVWNLVGKDKRHSLNGRLSLEESFNKFLDRSHIPDDVETLKDLIQNCCKTIQDYSEKFLILEETIEYLQSQLSVLKRFQYGQRSERLKKKP